MRYGPRGTPNEILISGIDDSGATSAGTISVNLNAGETVHFNSGDIENGNASKGLIGGLGDGAGNWRLKFTSNFDIDVMGLFRNADGFVNNDVIDGLMV